MYNRVRLRREAAFPNDREQKRGNRDRRKEQGGGTRTDGERKVVYDCIGGLLLGRGQASGFK